jgi:hypothetical protein
VSGLFTLIEICVKEVMFKVWRVALRRGVKENV